MAEGTGLKHITKQYCLRLALSYSMSLTLNHSFRLLAGLSLKEPEFSTDIVSPLCRCW